MNSKNRRCASCRKKVPIESIFVSNLKSFCSSSCLMQFVKSPKAANLAAKQRRADVRAVKQKHKTKSQYIKEAQIEFNAFIRARDKNENCISCSASLKSEAIGGGYDAGHLRSVGSAPHLRFRTDNCFGQCKKCNRYLSGNVSNMRVGVVWRYGQDYLDRVEVDNQAKNYSIDDLKRIKKIFAKKRKKIEKTG